MKWWDSLDVLPTIKAIRQQAEDVRQKELAKAIDMLNDLSPEDKRVVDTLTRSIVNKILHDPTDSLRTAQRSPRFALPKNCFICNRLGISFILN